MISDQVTPMLSSREYLQSQRVDLFSPSVCAVPRGGLLPKLGPLKLSVGLWVDYTHI